MVEIKSKEYLDGIFATRIVSVYLFGWLVYTRMDSTSCTEMTEKFQRNNNTKVKGFK